MYSFSPPEKSRSDNSNLVSETPTNRGTDNVHLLKSPTECFLAD